MIVWHVCSKKKLDLYRKNGFIRQPVRAWEDITYAERMSIRTGRRHIIRLKFPKNAARLEGHFGKARIIYQNYIIDKEQI